MIAKDGTEYGIRDGDNREDIDLHYFRHLFSTQMSQLRGDHDGSLNDVIIKYLRGNKMGDEQQDILEHDEMDIVPSNIDMTAAEPELTLSRRGGEQLALALETVTDDYDYIAIDCPPYLGYLTDNGLYAAQDILIPALAESTSKRALELLFDHVESLELDYEISIGEIGVVANRVEETNEATEMMEWFETAFPDVEVWEVRKRVALQRAFSTGVSIFGSRRKII